MHWTRNHTENTDQTQNRASAMEPYGNTRNKVRRTFRPRNHTESHGIKSTDILATETHGQHGLDPRNALATETHGNTRKQKQEEFGHGITSCTERNVCNDFIERFVFLHSVFSVCFRVLPWLISCLRFDSALCTFGVFPRLICICLRLTAAPRRS